MIKIKSSFLLLVLLSSLGIQITTAFATSSENVVVHEIEEVEPTEPVEEVKPPVEPTEPVEEVKPPVEPTEPVEEVKPPVKPTEPVEEVKPPVKPTEPVEEVKPPVKPTEPVEEVKPPVKPTEPVEEVKPPVTTINQTENNNYQYHVTSEIKQAPFHIAVTKSTQDFINEVGESARKIGQENDLYASVMIAQAILESASGKSALASQPNYNLFGIKGAYKGQSVSFNTSEDNGQGNLYTIQANFRKYPSYKESLEDYAELMKNGIQGNQAFYYGTTKKEAKTYQEATKFLTGKYATDTRYNEKLNKIIETYDLTFFDKELKEGKRKTIQSVEVKTYEVMNPINKEIAYFSVPLIDKFSVSSPFGNRGAEHHDGIDLATSENALVYASSDGVVQSIGYDVSAGNYVIIKHSNGLFTNYFHLNNQAVKKGDYVQTGNIVGYVGSTGNSTGSHLHFGISTKEWGGYLNASNYIPFN